MPWQRRVAVPRLVRVKLPTPSCFGIIPPPERVLDTRTRADCREGASMVHGILEARAQKVLARASPYFARQQQSQP